MRHPVLRTPLPVIGITTALIVGGGVAAFAAWDVQGQSETFTVLAAHIPRMGPPRVRSGAVPRIRWGAVELMPGVPAQRYIVTRSLGPLAQVACDVPPGATLQCADVFAPAGYQATYSVAATYGGSWVGPPGAPSRVVTMPGTAVPMLINGVMVMPGAGGVPIVDSPGVVPGDVPSAMSPSLPPSSSSSAPGPGPGPASAPPVPSPSPSKPMDRPQPPGHTQPSEPPSEPPSSEAVHSSAAEPEPGTDAQ